MRASSLDHLVGAEEGGAMTETTPSPLNNVITIDETRR